MVFTLIGSLGLFLMGMWLMTEGLKLAGGKALEHLLGQWTHNKARGLATGTAITALVQSSSAVTIATIGFVNAGLMQFRQALWVVFGSNVGTTFTAWIVTFFGFSVKIDAFTFPLIGVGAALHIFAPYKKGQALGMALAGFGLLFMGIDSLQSSFAANAESMNVEALLSESSYPTLFALVIGFLLTLLTQSSSAAIAIILTAVAGGVSGIEIAAAAVIGANVGTTSTALLASIGATNNAKRLAWAHVTFNGLTAGVALLIMPVFLGIVTFIYGATLDNGQTGHPNLLIMLAMFHTGFNLLGLLIIWPIEPKLSKKLLEMYKDPVVDKISSAHLDPNVATIPDLAIRAMTLELNKIIDSSQTIQLPSEENPESSNLSHLKEKLEGVEAFIALTFKSELTEKHAHLLTNGLNTSYHLKNAYRTFKKSVDEFEACKSHSAVAQKELEHWFDYINKNNASFYQLEGELNKQAMYELQEYYKRVKTGLLRASSARQLSPEILANALHAASLGRRYIEQLAEAYDTFKLFTENEQALPENRTDEITPRAEEATETEEEKEGAGSGTTENTTDQELPEDTAGNQA